MQMEKSTELRRLWKAHGSPPCEHPNYEQLYFLSSGTGDYSAQRVEHMSIQLKQENGTNPRPAAPSNNDPENFS